jgi:hypothetical protein
VKLNGSPLRLSPKVVEEMVVKLGYDPTDEVLIQRA